MEIPEILAAAGCRKGDDGFLRLPDEVKYLAGLPTEGFMPDGTPFVAQLTNPTFMRGAVRWSPHNLGSVTFRYDTQAATFAEVSETVINYHNRVFSHNQEKA